ncbi:hypothetical protein KCP73_09405 [Salmonella enterica subsp. enterica]|nr:hypothetical protein KCP73_09405 [Salmonella enterica subsp. enterica]
MPRSGEVLTSAHPVRVSRRKNLSPLLRRGDVIAHAFHGKGKHHSLTDEGAVLAEVRQAGKEALYLMPPMVAAIFFSMNTRHAEPSPMAFFRISSVAISQPSLNSRGLFTPAWILSNI